MSSGARFSPSSGEADSRDLIADRMHLMPYPRIVRRALDALRSAGLRRALTIVPRWWLRREYLVFVRDLRGPLPDVPAAPGVEWAIVDSQTLPALQCVEPHLTRREIERRWVEGQRCVLYRLDGVPAYVFWEATRSTYLPYLDRTFRPLTGDFLVFDVFAHPAFRGRGIARLSTTVGLHQAVAAGCQRWVAFVAGWNTPALRNARTHAGAEVVGSVGYRRQGWKRAYFATGLVRLHPDGSLHIDAR